MAWSRGRRGPAKPAQTSEEYAKQFAETLIKQIEEGTAPWQKTWEPGQRRMPRKIESEREYRGGNTLVLMATASSGRRLCMVNSQRRGRAKEPTRLTGCANRVLAPAGVSVWVPTMCRRPLAGTVARRTSRARAGTRSAGSVSRAA